MEIDEIKRTIEIVDQKVFFVIIIFIIISLSLLSILLFKPFYNIFYIILSNYFNNSQIR